MDSNRLKMIDITLIVFAASIKSFNEATFEYMRQGANILHKFCWFILLSSA